MAGGHSQQTGLFHAVELLRAANCVYGRKNERVVCVVQGQGNVVLFGGVEQAAQAVPLAAWASVGAVPAPPGLEGGGGGSKCVAKDELQG